MSNIASNGMQVLAALGLADRLTRAATATPVNYFRDGKGELLGEVPYGVVEVYGQPAVSMRLPSWHNDRIVLIGDAAHTVSPNSGQGASMALEDAMDLAKLIRDQPGDCPAAFASLEQARRSRVEEIVAEGRRRGGDKKTISPEEALTRNNFMKIGLRESAKKAATDPWLLYQIDW